VLRSDGSCRPPRSARARWAFGSVRFFIQNLRSSSTPAAAARGRARALLQRKAREGDVHLIRVGRHTEPEQVEDSRKPGSRDLPSWSIFSPRSKPVAKRELCKKRLTPGWGSTCRRFAAIKPVPARGQLLHGAGPPAPLAMGYVSHHRRSIPVPAAEPGQASRTGAIRCDQASSRMASQRTLPHTSRNVGSMRKALEFRSRSAPAARPQHPFRNRTATEASKSTR